MVAPTVLICPGLGNSGSDHWQSWLEARITGARRLEQADWDAPDPEDWVAALDAAVRDSATPVLLVAHSLACIMVARWACRPGAATVRVAAALLVAPPDVDDPALVPAEVRGFAPIPTEPLPFPALVVGSRNDPYCTAGRACACAAAWGADFIDAGEVGHINTAAGFGPWPQGEVLVRHLLEETGNP